MTIDILEIDIQVHREVLPGHGEGLRGAGPTDRAAGGQLRGTTGNNARLPRLEEVPAAVGAVSLV